MLRARGGDVKRTITDVTLTVGNAHPSQEKEGRDHWQCFEKGYLNMGLGHFEELCDGMGQSVRDFKSPEGSCAPASATH